MSDDCFWCGAPLLTFWTRVPKRSGHSFRGSSITATEAMTWAAAWPACKLVEERVVRARDLTRVLVSASVCCSHFCCSSCCLANSRALNAFLRARPAATRIWPSAFSSASAWTRVARYRGCQVGKRLATAQTREGSDHGDHQGPGRTKELTKLFSEAWVSCCSAAVRVALSVGEERSQRKNADQIKPKAIMGGRSRGTQDLGAGTAQCRVY